MSQEIDTETEPDLRTKREMLRGLLSSSRNAAYDATIKAQAGRASLAVIKGLDENDYRSVRQEAEANERKALAFRAAARRYAELLADLPTEAPADADTPTETNDPGA